MKIVMIVLCLVFVLYLSATIINVPADQPTIQEGINVAENGDTILVADGTYIGDLNKNLTWNGIEKHLIVKSENGTENCIIDCEDDGRAFCLNQTNQNSTDFIEGFTIINGSAEFGGAILLIFATPTITNCNFESNHSSDWNYAKGGALYVNDCFGLTIENCSFSNNISSAWWTGSGGAIYSSYSDLTISYSVFYNNIAAGSEGSGEGGGITAYMSDIYLINNTFFSNTAGGFYNGYGGGMYCDNSDISVINSIFWQNFRISGTIDNIHNEESQIYTEYCDFENGGFTGTGNIDSDPLFVNPDDGNLNLQSNSPCIDAGNPDPQYNDPDGTRNDMGAYYYNQVVSIENYELQISNFKLHNYPNPFNPTTTISFSIQEESNIDLAVYNIKGQKVKTLAQNEYTGGSHSVVWDGVDESGKKVGSGVYFYKLKVNGKIEAVKKCLLLK